MIKVLDIWPFETPNLRNKYNFGIELKSSCSINIFSFIITHYCSVKSYKKDFRAFNERSCKYKSSMFIKC